MIKKYKSRYGADSDITAAQYLVEFIMERIAKKDKVTLPYKFWNIPRWNKVFRMQIKYANELLSEYSEGEVFAALKTKQGQRIFSLGAKKTMIVPLIEEARKNKPRQYHVVENKQKDGKIETDFILEQEISNEVEVNDNIEQMPEKPNKNLWSKLG